MKSKKTKSSFFAAVSGASMAPTLRESEILEVAPCMGRPPRPGDVILFTPPGGERGGRAVAHRVVRVSGGGFRTRGDNNAEEDPWLARPEEVAGRVTAAWRGRRRRIILGGRPGLLASRLSRFRRIFTRGPARLLRAPYHALARSGLFRRPPLAVFTPRVVVFRGHGVERPRLLMGRRVVGRYDAARGQWIIRPPYRLFVNESTLPRG
ncbi:MAG: hypothetical protein GY859_35610 [Desulfobacterales bacterium]|nr:hypothetical protein [Desulfobacterales bacterium]